MRQVLSSSTINNKLLRQMKKESNEINDINLELSRLLESVKLTLDYDIILKIRKIIRKAFNKNIAVDVSLSRGREVRAYSYGELEFLDLKIDDIESIFCHKVVGCK